MLPHTHFLVASLFGLIGVNLGYFSYYEAFTIAIISTFVDLDHLFYYYKRHKKWSLIGAWNSAVMKHENESSFIQHNLGFLIVTLILIALFVVNRHLSILLFIAYYTHLLLDYAHTKLPESLKSVKFGTAVIPINGLELALDITTISLIFLFI